MSTFSYENVASNNLQTVQGVQHAVAANVSLAIAALSFLLPTWPENAVVAGKFFYFMFFDPKEALSIRLYLMNRNS